MVIKGQPDIKIYITDEGYICIKQPREDGEQLVEFAPAYGGKIAEAIGSLKDFAQEKFEKAVPVEE